METIQKPLIKQGWLRALIYLVGIFLITALAIAISYFLFKKQPPSDNILNSTLFLFGVNYAIMGILAILFTWMMRKLVDRKTFKSLGFAWKGFSNEAWLGFSVAVALLGIGSLILAGCGFVSFELATLAPIPLLLEVLIMVLVAFVEELMFRGYLLNNLLQSTNKWTALAISAVLFAIFHGSNPGITVIALVNIVLAGFLLGINYIFTQNLWFGIFFHFAWNYFQGPVLGYEVSGLDLSSVLQQSVTGPDVWTGGIFGFEGSLLCVLLLALAALLLFFVFNRRYQPVNQ